jgi:hypothetical protein
MLGMLPPWPFSRATRSARLQLRPWVQHLRSGRCSRLTEQGRLRVDSGRTQRTDGVVRLARARRTRRSNTRSASARSLASSPMRPWAPMTFATTRAFGRSLRGAVQVLGAPQSSKKHVRFRILFYFCERGRRARMNAQRAGSSMRNWAAFGEGHPDPGLAAVTTVVDGGRARPG